MRVIDTCARFGGDEFVIVWDRMLAEDVASVVERLKSVLAAGVPMAEHTVPVAASIGVALSSPGSLPLALLKEADAAMYTVKTNGRSTEPVTSGR